MSQSNTSKESPLPAIFIFLLFVILFFFIFVYQIIDIKSELKDHLIEPVNELGFVRHSQISDISDLTCKNGTELTGESAIYFLHDGYLYDEEMDFRKMWGFSWLFKITKFEAKTEVLLPEKKDAVSVIRGLSGSELSKVKVPLLLGCSIKKVKLLDFMPQQEIDIASIQNICPDGDIKLPQKKVLVGVYEDLGVHIEKSLESPSKAIVQVIYRKRKSVQDSEIAQLHGEKEAIQVYLDCLYEPMKKL